uniref:Uncharacterized protein n=2 Tax=Meloidogyne TaxID=189290 RepID=A0A6V7XZS1_MELEN|nr:unnamed protein product [Meloidogyne enterolobii]CAD2204745.1 unnamed protein product [Meloidogyne enterolobii]
MDLISYADAKKFLDDSLIEECIERRHITLGWQHSGNIGESIRRLVESSIGQFRKQISGVPIALGTIRLLKPIYILEDHNCMHVDFEVQMIVLKVQPGGEKCDGEGEKIISCKAKQVLKHGVVGTVFGNIGMVCSPAPHGIKENDVFKACFMGVKFKNSICQVQTIPLSIKKFSS